ncbi:uncharacterized protein LOC127797733 isoform X5 [Diospyros lotus]|uniref:uncharacterized protein LOC127797733 isoform X5 n=1 Tax=Diospyros lotus TaxID=55363 RepID=UPI00225A7998|nr:uncharacterized protein LOC127797733 isoform X5 [Diospyros lotus]
MQWVKLWEKAGLILITSANWSASQLDISAGEIVLLMRQVLITANVRKAKSERNSIAMNFISNMETGCDGDGDGDGYGYGDHSKAHWKDGMIRWRGELIVSRFQVMGKP